jgi:hypothetical protein
MANLKPIHLDTLKVSSISTEGPTKTATGGMAADTLLKYGKKFTIEMQDAMGRYETLNELYGANISKGKNILAITDRFPGEKTIVGTTFVVDQKTGAKQPLRICIPIFNCDGIFNLTQDAEGDVTTFDLNGQIARFESDAEGAVDETGKYQVGTDNVFYFFATSEAMGDIMTKGYRKVYEDTQSYVNTPAGSGTAAVNHANLEAMLNKFGVVTVMDIDIYPTVRFEQAVKSGDKITYKYSKIDDTNGSLVAATYEWTVDKDYQAGEWDAVGTFLAYVGAPTTPAQGGGQA